MPDDATIQATGNKTIPYPSWENEKTNNENIASNESQKIYKPISLTRDLCPFGNSGLSHTGANCVL